MSGDELSRLHDRIDQQNELLVQVRDSVQASTACMEKHQAVCAEQMKHLDGEVCSIKRAIWGNGREGHDDRIKGLETTVNAIQADRKRVGVGGTQISLKAVIGIITAVGTLLGGLLAYLPNIIKAFN